MVGDFYPSNWSGCVSRALYFQNIYKVRENVGTHGAVLYVDTFRKNDTRGRFSCVDKKGELRYTEHKGTVLLC